MFNKKFILFLVIFCVIALAIAKVESSDEIDNTSEHDDNPKGKHFQVYSRVVRNVVNPKAGLRGNEGTQGLDNKCPPNNTQPQQT